MNFLAVTRPISVNAAGLFQCLEESLHKTRIHSINTEECKNLIGIGTDGASVNVALAGLKGLVESEVPWIFWEWCLAHKIELAIEDALKGTEFDFIDEMLLYLYYVYEKSPKKCHELQDVIAEVKQCIEVDDEGIWPLRSSGTRWVSHKLNAMKHILSKFSAYTSHFTAMVEDSTVPSADRAKF